MTKIEIIKCNKLIAEFMGYKYITGEGWLLNGVLNMDSISIKTNTTGFLARHHRDLKYYNDWNWLMGVVAKINKMLCDPKEMFMGTTLERKIEFNAILILPICTNINVVYNRVVEFIEWYNKQK